MCGIAGILFFNEDETVSPAMLRAAADAISHRGPDAHGDWHAPGIGLAHRRLSIIDLDSGEQPMGNEDGSVQVVFNGEIYNFEMLRRELASRGHRFRTRSDTEVLVHLYEEEGDKLVERLRGMFAFALWDSRKQRLLLARDRVGLKPLYYYRDNDKLIFASEIKAILACGDLNLDIDPAAVDDFLMFGMVPGERSIYRQIRKLPAGHVLSVSRNDFTASPTRYWQLNVEPDDRLTTDDWLAALDEKFQESVQLHLASDVPVGAFLSGGLDSSAVVAAMAQTVKQPIQTFSIGFHEKQFDESPYARQVAELFGTRHFEEFVTPEAVGDLDDLVQFYDEPFADASAIPSMWVSRLAAEHVKVVLSGDGGDEAFGGYSRYRHDVQEARVRGMLPQWFRRSILRNVAACWPKADWLPRVLRAKTTLTNLSLDADSAYANSLSICRPPLRRQLLQRSLQQQLNGHRPEQLIQQSFSAREGDALAGMIAADVAVLLPDDFLTKVDRASMSVGLEVRPPLLDHEFLELAARVPSQWKIRNGETKWIFKELCTKRLPDNLVRRRKQGFEIPIDHWLRGPLRDVVEANVLAPNAAIAAVIDQDVASRLYRNHLRRTERNGNLLWSLLVLGCWMEKYGRGSSRPGHDSPELAAMRATGEGTSP